MSKPVPGDLYWDNSAHSFVLVLARCTDTETLTLMWFNENYVSLWALWEFRARDDRYKLVWSS